MIEIYCDMDMVLVQQTGRDHFDTMPWLRGGKDLWAFIKPHRPKILSMLRPDIYEKCAPQKRVWCARELGPDVEVIVTPFAIGKAPYSKPGAVLIDDAEHTHGEGWRKGGGIFVHHRRPRGRSSSCAIS